MVRVWLAVLLALLVVVACKTVDPRATTNIALNRPIIASSVYGPGMEAAKAVDGNTTTRWASVAQQDPSTLIVDLGKTYTITGVKLVWEAAFGKSYRIDVSADNLVYTTIYSTTTGDGGTDDITGLSGKGQYVRMYGMARGTNYGYSLWEFEVYGTESQPDVYPDCSVPFDQSKPGVGCRVVTEPDTTSDPPLVGGIDECYLYGAPYGGNLYDKKKYNVQTVVSRGDPGTPPAGTTTTVGCVWYVIQPADTVKQYSATFVRASDQLESPRSNVLTITSGSGGGTPSPTPPSAPVGLRLTLLDAIGERFAAFLPR